MALTITAVPGPRDDMKSSGRRQFIQRRSSWQQGHGAAASEIAALFLMTECFQLFWGRTNENDGRGAAGAGEVGTLGQKSAPWMYGVAPGLHCECEQMLDIEVSGGTRGTERQAAIGSARMQAADVVARLHSYRFEAEVMRSPGDPDGNFAAIRDEDPVQTVFPQVRIWYHVLEAVPFPH
jgi:hypothetical protein